MKSILTHSFGKAFPSSFVFTGYIFLSAGIIIMFNNLLGLILVLIGVFIAFVKSGVQINLETNSYRKFDSLFGLKRGQWESLEAFSYLSILRTKEESATLSRSNRRAVTSSDLFYDICLLDENHRKKQPIKRLKEKNIALSDIKILSAQLGMAITEYRPPLSKKSKIARRKR